MRRYISENEGKDFQTEKKLLKKILPYIMEHRSIFILLGTIALLSNIFNMLGPYFVGKGVGILKESMDKAEFLKLGKISIILALLYILAAYLNYLQNVNLNNVTQKIVSVMRDHGFEKMNRLTLSYLDSSSHGNIISILINDIDNISSSISTIVSQIFISILTVLVTLGIMFYIDPILAGIQIFLVIITGLFLRNFSVKSREKMRERQRYLGVLSGYIEENFLGQWEVKNFSYENRGIDNFNKLSRSYKENSVKAFFFGGFNYPTLNFIGNLSYSIIIFVGTYFILKGRITLAALTSFIIYARMFNRPIANISDFYNIFQSVAASAERYFEFLESPLEENSERGEKVPENISGEIEFENVSFGYDKSRETIENLSFKVRPGQSVAIVGPTGAGKSTLMNLLMRFYEIDKGKILLDGVDIQKYSKKSYRKLFGVVLQDVWIFNGTVLENIIYGNEKISMEEVMEICKAVGIHDSIMELQGGYGWELNEENMNFSAGQKQLLTIARAIINNPKFLILDEATSGVDTRTEKKLVAAIKNITEERTSFIIAHRLSTVKNADLILVVRDGKIVESGTHEELLLKRRFYFEMYNHLIN